MKEVKLEDLREKASTEYGIVNASEMSPEQLQDEMDAIDAQVPQKDKQEDDGEVKDAQSGDQEVPLADMTRADLEAKANKMILEGDADPSDKKYYPNKESLVTAIENKDFKKIED